MGELKIKRAYEDLTSIAGKRVLVDRIWPRGIKKETLHLDLWEKEIAPSSELRKNFGHVPEKYPWFKAQYEKELENNPIYPSFLEQIRHWLQNENVFLLFGAKDETHNQAVVLQEKLQEDLKK
ncbi:DUF488 domain-containing protein [Enterococcus sp. LJL98]